jgi:hypothetical protein
MEATTPGSLATPAFRLAAACCRWPPSPARDAAVQAAAAAIADWDAVVALARRQRVAGLVHDALATAAVRPPAAPADTLARQAQQIFQQNLLLAAETCRLQRLLAAADIPCIALKGVALAALAYGSLRVKDTRDIDVLVPPDRALAAVALLRRDGYALSFPAQSLSETQLRAVVRFSREVALLHPDKRVCVELQWRVAYNRELLKAVNAASPAQDVIVADGASVRTLANDDLFAYLCVHGAGHAWSRLKWLADLNAFLASTGADVSDLHRHAEALGVGFCSAQGLLLCRRLFGLQLPDGLAAELQGPARVKKLFAVAMAAMADRNRGDGDAPSATRSVRTQFLLGRGFAFFTAQCRAIAVSVSDIVALPLPRRWYVLYPLLRLPLWLWRRATQ